MDVNTAAVTVRVVVPKTPVTLSVALIVAVPGATDDARPLEPAALEIVVTVPDEFSLQVTVAVRSAVAPLSYVPVAVNCFVKPALTLGLVGVTLMETRVAGLTVRVVDPEIVPVPGS